MVITNHRIRSQIFTINRERAVQLARTLYPRENVKIQEGQEISECRRCKNIPISGKQYGGEWVLIGSSHTQEGP